MTTQELKQQTDKVLGNSIRCLLPSYWWKRLFHQVVDRIDEVEQSVDSKADKGYVDSKVNEVKESSNQVLFYAPIGGQLSTDKKVVNKQSYQRVMDGYSKGLYFVTKVSGGFGILDSIMIVSPDITGGQLKMIILNELGIGFQRLSVSSDGSATIEEIMFTDSELSDTSTNALQNKVIKAAIDSVAPVFIINKTSGFSRFWAALYGAKSNGYPRGIVQTDDDAQIEIDGVSAVDNANIAIEFNYNGGLYKWIFNKSTGAFVSEEVISSSEGVSDLPIYVAIGDEQLSREQVNANVATYTAISNDLLSRKIPFVEYVSANASVAYHIYMFYPTSNGVLFYTSDWDNGSPSTLMKWKLNADGTTTFVEYLSLGSGTDSGTKVYILAGSYELAEDAIGYFNEIADNRKPVAIFRWWDYDNQVYRFCYEFQSYIKEGYGYIECCLSDHRKRFKFSLSDGLIKQEDNLIDWVYVTEERDIFLADIEQLLDAVDEITDTLEMIIDDLGTTQVELSDLTKLVDQLESRVATLEGN